ncbi:hypothetical protein JCM6882_002857 [Rhodosporidiobolus microsporus]
MLPSPARSPTKRLAVLSIAAASVVLHLWLAAKLAAVQGALVGNQGGEDGDSRELEGAEWKRLAGVGALLGIGRLWSLCSAGVAIVGAYGVLKDRLSFLRLFVLNSFLSLALDALLSFLILLLLTLAAPSSSGLSLATILCQVLSTSASSSSSSDSSSAFSIFSIGLPDLLGLSLEGCEDRFDGVLLSSLTVLGLIEALRAWAALKLLRYYTAATTHRGSTNGRRGRRPDPLALPTERDYRRNGEYYQDSPVELDGSSVFSAAGASPHHKKKRRDSLRRERSVSGSSAASHQTRILLLPRPEDRATPSTATAPGGKDMEVPLLALTASSPVRTSFPPGAQAPPTSPAGRSGKDKGKVLVYAPVYMSVEEARTCGAQELVLHNRPSRSSSGHQSSSSSSTTTGGGARSRSGTIVPSPPATSASSPLSVDTSKRGAAVRQDSEGSEMATPVAARPSQQQMGIMEVLRGDLEEDEERLDKGKRA